MKNISLVHVHSDTKPLLVNDMTKYVSSPPDEPKYARNN